MISAVPNMSKITKIILLSGVAFFAVLLAILIYVYTHRAELAEQKIQQTIAELTEANPSNYTAEQVAELCGDYWAAIQKEQIDAETQMNWVMLYFEAKEGDSLESGEVDILLALMAEQLAEISLQLDSPEDSATSVPK